MYKLQPLQTYFSAFYMLGFNPFVSFKKTPRKVSLFAQYFPIIVHIALNIWIIYYLYPRKNRGIFLAHFEFTFTMYSSSNLVPFFEQIFYSNSFPINFQTMSLTVDNLETHLAIKYPFNKIQRNFLKRFVLQLIVNFGGLLIKYYVPTLTKYTWSHYIASATFYFHKYLHLLNILIYIDFIKFALECLSEKIVIVKNEMDYIETRDEIKNHLHIIQQIKLTHYKLWHIVQRVNKQFGWFLIVYLIEGITIAAFLFYRVFTVIEISRGIVAIRKIS